MATVFLDEPTRQVDQADQVLDLAKPETEAYKTTMLELIQALNAAQLECVMDLRPTSDPELFERLQIFITRVRDSSYKIIMAIGNPARDFEPIKAASELLNALDAHIFLGKHVENLSGKPTAIGADVKDLSASIDVVMSRLGGFINKLELTFIRLRRL